MFVYKLGLRVITSIPLGFKGRANSIVNMIFAAFHTVVKTSSMRIYVYYFTFVYPYCQIAL